MNNIFKHYLIIGLVSTFLYSQASAGREMIRVNEYENGNTVHVQAGDLLEILLEGNPATGYSWNVDQLDPAMLKQGQSDFIAASGGLGSAGTVVLHFEAVAVGTTVLTLHYKRPFEKGMLPLKVFKLSIVVNHP